MSTGWHVVPGYSVDGEPSPEEIQECARRVDTEDLRLKALKYGSPEECPECGTKLEEIIALYQDLPTEDATCRFTEEGVHQMRSGGSGCSVMKKHVRRAFCALLWDECCRLDMSVQILVG